MSRLITKFYNNTDIYDDGDIESELLDHYKNPESSVDISNDKYFYFITDTRQNILNWYPFLKNDSILEIGSGCGTITEMLCTKAKQVVAIEGSKRRAEITHYRHKRFKNLTVYAGDFSDVKLNQKFDYIVMVGVFEYANQFFQDIDNPFDFFLEKLKPFLKPTGKVLMAIENRYGIKYWAGCNEDHIIKPYVGIEGYDNSKICRTFGKKELINLLSDHEFTKIKFYYPFPDYKLPNIIYSDEHLPKLEEFKDIPIYPYSDQVNFNINTALKGLIENDLIGLFSNSFLVEFGKKSATLSDTTFARILNYRTCPYKTITTEHRGHKYYKSAVHPDGLNHLKSIVHNHELLKKDKIPTCHIKLSNNTLNLEYIEGNTLCSELLKLAAKHDYEKIESQLDALMDFYRAISNFKKLTNPINPKLTQKGIYDGKTYVLKRSILDGNMSNIIHNKSGDFILIDQEWLSDKELPADYLFYYSINYLARYTSSIDQSFIQKILDKYHITTPKQKIFLEVEQSFYQNLNVIDERNKARLDGCKLYSYTNVAPEAQLTPSNTQPAADPIIHNLIKAPNLRTRIFNKAKYFTKVFLHRRHQ